MAKQFAVVGTRKSEVRLGGGVLQGGGLVH